MHTDMYVPFFFSQGVEAAMDCRVARPDLIVGECEFSSDKFKIMVACFVQTAVLVVMPDLDMQGVQVVVVEAGVAPSKAKGRCACP